MLRKLTIGVLGLVFILGAGWFTALLFTHQPSDGQPQQIQEEQPGTRLASSAVTLSAASSPSVIPNLGATSPEQASDGTPEEKQEASIAKRIDELQDLGMESDPVALDAILSEINNPEPRIREAAISAAVQFGSRDAIPKLEEALARAEDPKDKSALLEAIEFLKLPTLTEALSQTNPPAGFTPVAAKP